MQNSEHLRIQSDLGSSEARNIPEISRRILLRQGVALGATFLLTGCLNIVISEIPLVKLEDLIRDPEPFFQSRIRTQGYPEYVGEKTYFIPYTYIDPLDQQPKISLSQIVRTTHRLHIRAEVQSDSLAVIQQTGGLSLPLPIVGALGYKYSLESLYEVTGYVSKLQDQYYLAIAEAKDLSKP